jgi:TRAP-type C4-dicarboxylate transport system permease small subunit
MYGLILFCCILFIYYGTINAAVVWNQQSHNIPIFTYGYLYIVVPIAFTLMAFRTLGLMVLSVLEYKTKKGGGR